MFSPVRIERHDGRKTTPPVLVVKGKRQLRGNVRISGAKNAVLKLMVAALLTPEPCVIRNVPYIGDVLNMVEVLQGLGATCEWDGDSLTIQCQDLSAEAPEDPVREMRASVQVMGPLLGRLGEVKIAHPGGCAIGARPVDLHLLGLRKLGAEINEIHGQIEAKARKLIGGNIYLDIASVGATENLMMAAAVADGVTVIKNAAKEPEIVEVQNFINCMGGNIRGAGTDTIRIVGVNGPLRGVDYTVIPDRIEAGTWATFVAVAGGDLTIGPVITEHLEMITTKLVEAGVDIEIKGDIMRIRRSGRLNAIQIRTQVYPGFPTDMQPQMLALMTVAEGTSIVTETVHSSRFKHVEELRRMGANIVVDGRVAVVRAPAKLTGAKVEATDLRAGAALISAALGAEGTTIVEGVHHIDRGYEDIAGKLRAVGANVHQMLPAEVAVS